MGKICQGFYLSQYQENMQITDFANVAYFKFGSEWHRLYFEGSTIFWRNDQRPIEAVNSDLNSISSLVNLSEMESVVGCKILSIVYSSNESEICVIFSFSSGTNLKFIHHSDEDSTKICMC